jgi:hypothetical protein
MCCCTESDRFRFLQDLKDEADESYMVEEFSAEILFTRQNL